MPQKYQRQKVMPSLQQSYQFLTFLNTLKHDRSVIQSIGRKQLFFVAHYPKPIETLPVSLKRSYSKNIYASGPNISM